MSRQERWLPADGGSRCGAEPGLETERVQMWGRGSGYDGNADGHGHGGCGWAR